MESVEKHNTLGVIRLEEAGVEEAEQTALEEPEQDDICPICRELLFQPVTSSCQPVPHTACYRCIMTWVPHTSTSAGVAHYRCPYCRSETFCSVDYYRQRTLRHKYPQSSSAKESEYLRGLQVAPFFLLFGDTPSHQHRLGCYLLCSLPSVTSAVHFQPWSRVQLGQVITRREYPYQVLVAEQKVSDMEISIQLTEGWEWDTPTAPSQTKVAGDPFYISNNKLSLWFALVPGSRISHSINSVRVKRVQERPS
ncbi:hypothetical protein BKA67DRAFT_694415 [Truncatella angustata]|uniref:RING-type domain-containing protein n=1 Tax=Truncatella angustata TaxID=152316 RepID=A0A9P8RQ57_9PEZI|nr:uncharacterized protein BKA67DRAFT_694415 [Truncatella angustata]KAH6647337.1 hypothetical protein BKA67DRAFT_694415 [Truncatella angustata]